MLRCGFWILEPIWLLLRFRLRLLGLDKLRYTALPSSIAVRYLLAEAGYFLGVALDLLLFGMKRLMRDGTLPALLLAFVAFCIGLLLASTFSLRYLFLNSRFCIGKHFRLRHGFAAPGQDIVQRFSHGILVCVNSHIRPLVGGTACCVRHDLKRP